MQRTGGRYAHAYHGHSTSRGSRFLSKLYKGIKPGTNVEKAFQEIAQIREKTKGKMNLSKDQMKYLVKDILGKGRK